MNYTQIAERLHPIQHVLKHLRFALRAYADNLDLHINIDQEQISCLEIVESLENYLSAFLCGFRFFEKYIIAANGDMDQFLESQVVRTKDYIVDGWGKRWPRFTAVIPMDVDEQLKMFDGAIEFFEDEDNLQMIELVIAQVMPFAAQPGGFAIFDISRSTHPGFGTHLFEKQDCPQTLHPWIDAINNFQLGITRFNIAALFATVKGLILEYNLLQMDRPLDFELQKKQTIIALLFRAHYQITANYNRILDYGFTEKIINDFTEYLVKFALANNLIDFNTYLQDPMPGISASRQPFMNMTLTPARLTALQTQLSAVWGLLIEDSVNLADRVYAFMAEANCVMDESDLDSRSSSSPRPTA